MSNKISLDYADNSELKAALEGKSPGDRVTLEIEVMVIEAGDQKFEGDVESISVDSHSEDYEETDVDDLEPTDDAPLLIVVAEEKKRKSKPEKDAESDEDESDGID